jgi:two-component system, OmpR family, alkaline phosphatase synthesis response regulator PhoP
MTKILVIEDEEPIRANLLEILEDNGYQVAGAANGLIGVMGALSFHPDLILCDVMMPELDGHGVLAALRQDPTTATIPLIFLTAKADKTDIREAMSLGADDYLTKPFSYAEVLASIATRLEKQQAVVQQYASELVKADQLYQKVQGVEQTQAALKDFLSKINMLIYVLKQSVNPDAQDSALALLESECHLEIGLLNQVPQLQSMLAPENVEFLRELSLLK